MHKYNMQVVCFGQACTPAYEHKTAYEHNMFTGSGAGLLPQNAQQLPMNIRKLTMNARTAYEHRVRRDLPMNIGYVVGYRVP